MKAEDSVAFDHHSIKAALTIATNHKINVEKKSLKLKHGDDHQYPLMLTYKRFKNVQDFW